MSFFTQQQIDDIINIALGAGEIAKDYFYKKSFIVNKKSDQSEVTSADIEVSNFIYKSLGNNFPKIPIICEEQNKAQFSKEEFFLIDPIDGTSGYIKNSDQFSVNIALVKDRKPIFGLIYAPVFEGGKLFCSSSGGKILEFNNLQELLKGFISSEIDVKNLNSNILQVRNQKSNSLSIVTSKRSQDQDLQKFIHQFYPTHIKKHSIAKKSSAIKFFDILEGNCNVYVHFNPTMEWDTAAGQALIESNNFLAKKLTSNEAGFKIDGNLEYGKKNYLNSAFVIY